MQDIVDPSESRGRLAAKECHHHVENLSTSYNDANDKMCERECDTEVNKTRHSPPNVSDKDDDKGASCEHNRDQHHAFMYLQRWIEGRKKNDHTAYSTS